MSRWDAGFAVSAALAGALVVMAVVGGAFYPLPAAAVGTALAALLGLAHLVRPPRLDRLEAVLAVCVVWGVVAAAVARTAPLAAKETITGWLVALALLVVARRSTEHARRVRHGFLIGGAMVIGIGVIAEAMVLGSARAGGLFENPDLAAAILAPMVAVAWGDKATTLRRVLVCVLVVAVVLTGSRAALLALVAAAVVVAPRRWQRRTAGAVGLLAVAGAVWWRLLQHPDSLAWFRLRIWGAVLRLVASSPVVGTGPGGLADAAGTVRLPTPSWCALHGYRILYAESSILGWVVQTGLIGLLLGVGAAWVWSRAARAADGLNAPWQRAMLAAMFVVLLFHDLVQIKVVLWWWSVLLASTVTVGTPRHRAVSSRWRAERLVAAVVICGVVLWGMVQPALARSMDTGGGSPRVVDRALTLEPWLDRAPRVRADELLQQRKRWTWEVAGEAQERAETAVAVHPQSALCWAAVGRVNARIVTDLGVWPSAVDRAGEAFARASSLEPELPWYWLDWARLERALGRTGRARELITHATEAEPRCVPAWLLLARLELDAGRLAAARAAFDRALQARRCGRGRLLSAYERALLTAPAWQWRVLETSLR